MSNFVKTQTKSTCLIAFFLAYLSFTQATTAQVTPNELSRLSLEELLGVEIEDISDNKRWLVSYEFRHLNVGQYQTGTDRLTFDDVQFTPGETRTETNYPIVPTYIKQSVHAFSIGREITNSFALSISVPFVKQSTQHISFIPGFAEFEIKSDGVGDIAVLSQYKFHRTATAHGSFGLGISFPVGSINRLGDTPRAGTGTLERLPYTMQIGSGTYDFLANIAYERDVNTWAVGLAGSATIRTGMNNNGYRLGDNYGIEVSARYKAWARVRPALSVSLRTTQHIKGGDESLLVPGTPFPFGASITDPDNYGGEKAKLGGSLTFCIKATCGLNFTIRAALPFYQNLDGIQLRERFSLSSAVNYSF